MRTVVISLFAAMTLSLVGCAADQELVEVEIVYLEDGTPVFSWPEGPVSELTVARTTASGEAGGRVVWSIGCLSDAPQHEPNPEACILPTLAYGELVEGTEIQTEAEILEEDVEYWILVDGFDQDRERPYFQGNGWFTPGGVPAIDLVD